MATKTSLSSLLEYGAVNSIAKELNLSPAATSAALRRGNLGHPAVILALQKAEQSGALAAAQQLAKLTPVAQ